MELCVSTTASARATAAPYAPLRRVTAVQLRRRLPARGWRCSSAAVPDPVPSEEPAFASSTVVVTDKPDSPADEEVEEVSVEEISAAPSGSEEAPVAVAEAEKVEEVSATPSGSAEAPVAVAEVVSSEPSPSPDDLGLDDILSKLNLNIEVTPTLILTASSGFVVLWVLSSIVFAVDSVPPLRKFLELVGTGYSIWFTARYLIFKESRDDLFAKFEDLKQRII
nr:unnamed protein product [Digitaria exilis]